eukprot:scaffold282_cov345-Pavlova_lutheri.AAC.14
MVRGMVRERDGERDGEGEGWRGKGNLFFGIDGAIGDAVHGWTPTCTQPEAKPNASTHPERTLTTGPSFPESCWRA